MASECQVNGCSETDVQQTEIRHGERKFQVKLCAPHRGTADPDGYVEGVIIPDAKTKAENFLPGNRL